MLSGGLQCGRCKYFDRELDPDGCGTGTGFCCSLATKRIGGEFRSPVGWVAHTAFACSHFIPKDARGRDSGRVGTLLAPPPLRSGIEIERAIEIQAGLCVRQQDSLSASAPRTVALDRDQLRFCEIQLAAALANPEFFGRLTFVFGCTDSTVTPSLVEWTVRPFPPGGELRTR
jgi:hypothetical protein